MQFLQKTIALYDKIKLKMSATVYLAKATGQPNQMLDLMFTHNFNPLNVKSYQNSLSNHELPYILAHSKNINVLALDMDFMGLANHIDTVGAEKVKYNILEALHNKFGGAIIFAQSSAKFYAIVRIDKLPENIMAKISSYAEVNNVIAQGINEVLGDRTTFNYNDKENHTKNMADELQIPQTKLLELNHAAVSTPRLGKNPLEFLDKLMMEAKQSLAGAKAVIIEVKPQDISAFTEPYIVNRGVTANITLNIETYKQALLHAEQMLPTEFIQKNYSGLNEDTREVLNNYNLSKWTQIKFNRDDTLVYNKQAVIKLLDTINDLTRAKLEDALKTQPLTPRQNEDIKADLNKADGKELSTSAKTALGKYTFMITADGAAIGAQNYSLGWDNTDQLNYSLVCQKMNEKMQNMGLEKVLVAVTGGDEFAFIGITNEAQSPSARKEMELILAKLYGEVLSSIKSTIITVTREDLHHALNPNIAMADRLWELNSEYALKYAKGKDLPVSDLIKENSITMSSGAFPIPYNKCYLDIDAFKHDTNGKKLLAILHKYGLVPEKSTGIYELKVNLAKPEIPADVLNLLINTGVIRIRQGVDGSAAVIGENPRGLETAQILADGDNYTQIAKARGRTVLLRDIKKAIGKYHPPLDYILDTYFKPTANNTIFLLKDRDLGNAINTALTDNKLITRLSLKQLDKLAVVMRESSSIITDQEITAVGNSKTEPDHNKEGMTPENIPNLENILAKWTKLHG